MRRRIVLWTGCLGLAVKGQSLGEEITLPLRALTAQGTTLYGLEGELDRQIHTFLVDTSQPLTWIDRQQTRLPFPSRGKSEQIVYPDDTTVQGQRLETILRLGTWQQSTAVLVADRTQSALPGMARWVQQYLAQGALGLGGLTGLRRYTLRCGGKRPTLLLNPSYYSAALTLPLKEKGGYVLLGQDPPLLAALHSTLPFILMSSRTAQRLGIQDWIPFPAPGLQLGQVTTLVKIRLGNLYLRFDPPQVLVVEAPAAFLNGLDLVLGLPFFEQVTVTWDTATHQVHFGSV